MCEAEQVNAVITQAMSDATGERGKNAERRLLQEAVRISASRMVDARSLCGLTQVEASQRIGFANSGALAKIEMGAQQAQLWMLVQAAKVYDVSTDYLLGLTDDWEPDERLLQRVSANWVYESWERTRKRDLEALAKLERVFVSIAINAKELAVNVLGIEHAHRMLSQESNPVKAEHFMAKRGNLISNAAGLANKIKRKMLSAGIYENPKGAQLVLSMIASSEEKNEHGKA